MQQKVARSEAELCLRARRRPWQSCCGEGAELHGPAMSSVSWNTSVPRPLHPIPAELLPAASTAAEEELLPPPQRFSSLIPSSCCGLWRGKAHGGLSSLSTGWASSTMQLHSVIIGSCVCLAKARKPSELTSCPAKTPKLLMKGAQSCLAHNQVVEMKWWKRNGGHQNVSWGSSSRAVLSRCLFSVPASSFLYL